LPYKSEAQRRYFNANRDKLEAEGVDVDEWNESSKGKKMPEKVAIEKLARCWQGYEPVPGKAPYSNDSCRPKGSKAKKKDEKKASLIPDFNSVRGLAKLAALGVMCSCGQPEDECGCNKQASCDKMCSCGKSEDECDCNKGGKQAAAASKAKDIVNMDSRGGVLADYLTPGSWGGERAGRTQAMADAMDENTTFNVRHPKTSQIGHTLGGGLIGSSLGGLLGSLISGEREHQVGGATIGGVLGGVGGTLLSGRRRRDEMKRIGHFYDKDREEGKLNPKRPEFSSAATVLLPSRGPHRIGQLEAFNAIKGNKSIEDQRGSFQTGSMRDNAYAFGMLPTIGGAVSLPHNYLLNIKTELANERKKEKPEDFKRNPKSTEKKSSLIPDFSSVYGLAKIAATSVAYSLGMPAASSAIGAGMGYLGHKLSDAIHPYEDEDDRRQARNTSMLMGAGGGLGRGMLHVAMRNANQASMDPGASTSKERQAAFEFKMSQRAKENAAKVNAVMERIKATGK
jgi:hypothetical protein